MHGLDHVSGQLANVIVDLLDPSASRPQDRVAVLQDRQYHFSSRVKAGKFLTPASFNASITLMIVPKEAFLSACSASVDLRGSGKSRTAPSSSSTLVARPSSLISSLSLMLTIAWSSSAGGFCAVFDSGKLIWTSGWSFLNDVETTKKIRRMIRISTSETMIMRGARRFRTAKFMCSDVPRVSGYRCRNRYLRGGRYVCRPELARGAAVIAFVNQLNHQRFHLHRHHFYFSRKIAEPDQRRHGNRKSENGCIQRFGDAKRNLAGIRCAGAQSK